MTRYMHLILLCLTLLGSSMVCAPKLAGPTVTARLLRIYHLANATEKLDRVIIFGSYITTKPDPNDIDVVFVMCDDFEIHTCDEATRRLFDHLQATEAFGASVFWLRPSLLFLETLEEFIAGWQIKRDLTRRGIVEVRL